MPVHLGAVLYVTGSLLMPPCTPDFTQGHLDVRSDPFGTIVVSTGLLFDLTPLGSVNKLTKVFGLFVGLSRIRTPQEQVSVQEVLEMNPWTVPYVYLLDLHTVGTTSGPGLFPVVHGFGPVPGRW